MVNNVFILHYLNWLSVFGVLVHFASLPLNHSIILWPDFCVSFLCACHIVQVKQVKLSWYVYAMKAYRGSGGTAPLFLHLRCMVSLMPLVLYSWRKSSHIPIEGGWVGPWASLDITDNLTPTRTWTASCLAHSLVSVILWSEQGNNSGLWTRWHHCITFILHVQCWALNYGISRLNASWLSIDAAAVQTRLEQNFTTVPVLLLMAPIFNYSSCSNTQGVWKIRTCSSEWRLLLSLFNLPARA